MYTHTGETCTVSEILWTVKRSAAYIGVVGIAASKERHGGQCLLQVMFSYLVVKWNKIILHVVFFGVCFVALM